jgi:hypothetical protein
MDAFLVWLLGLTAEEIAIPPNISDENGVEIKEINWTKE